MLTIIAACGFTPVYRTKSPKSDLTSIQVEIIPDRDGQVVRNHLIDRLYNDGYPADPQYSLIVSKIEGNIIKIGIDRDDDASRAQLRQSASFQLIDSQTNTVVLTRVVRATSGYNILTGQFTTYVTREDARKQALKAISENIMTQLEIYFSQ